MTMAELRKRARAVGVFGNQGGWLTLPCGIRLQGWNALGVWLDQIRKRLPWNLAEIVDGRRVGIPTLSMSDRQDLAAGLLAHGPVQWRD